MYLDPGLGGMLIQLVVAAVAAGGAVVFFMRKKIRALLSKDKKSDSALQSAPRAGNIEDDAVDMIPDDKE